MNITPATIAQKRYLDTLYTPANYVTLTHEINISTLAGGSHD